MVHITSNSVCYLVVTPSSELALSHPDIEFDSIVSLHCICTIYTVLLYSEKFSRTINFTVSMDFIVSSKIHSLQSNCSM